MSLARERLEPAQLIRVEDLAAVHGHLRVMRGPGTAGDQDKIRGDPGDAAAPFDLECVRVGEFRGTFDHMDAIAPQLVPHDVALARPDGLDPEREIADRDLLLQLVMAAVERPLAKSGEVEDPLTKRLRGIVPLWSDTPPSWPGRSTTATFLPSLAAAIEAFCPAGPDPMTARSYLWGPSLALGADGPGSRRGSARVWLVLGLRGMLAADRFPLHELQILHEAARIVMHPPETPRCRPFLQEILHGLIAIIKFDIY
jgi:hypothetical protein